MACNINRINKLEPSALDIWSSTLARTRVPLWVSTGAGSWAPRGRREAMRSLGGEAAARGLRRKRLLGADRAPTLAHHAARLARCSLALDGRRWGAHTTALDALYAGVGVLSVQGEALASRAAHSLTHAAGAPSLSAHSLREHSDIGVALLTLDGRPRGGTWHRQRRLPVAVEVRELLNEL